MTIADATFQSYPELNVKVVASAPETDPETTFTRKTFSYEQVLERVRWLSENATLLKP